MAYKQQVKRIQNIAHVDNISRSGNFLDSFPASKSFRPSNVPHRYGLHSATWARSSSAFQRTSNTPCFTAPFRMTYLQTSKTSLRRQQSCPSGCTRWFSSTPTLRSPFNSLLKQVQGYYIRAPPPIRSAINIAVGAVGLATALFISPFILGLFAFAGWRVYRQLKRQQIPFPPFIDFQQPFRNPGGLNAAVYTNTNPMMQTFEKQVKDHLRLWLRQQRGASSTRRFLLGNMTPAEWVNSLIVVDTDYSMSSSSILDGFRSKPQSSMKVQLTVELRAVTSPSSIVIAKGISKDGGSPLTIQSIRIAASGAGAVDVPLTISQQQEQQGRIFEGEFRDL